MAITINLPELGEGVDSVDVVSVLVAVGDTVEVDQSLMEVETEKASVEIPSTAAGTITEILVAEGDTLGENAPLITLEAADSTEHESVQGEPDSEAESDPDPDPDPFPVPDETAQPAEAPAPATPSPEPPQPPVGSATPSGALIPAAPTVRRFAREVGVDLTKVEGSGPGGRISIDDVKAHAHRLLSRDSAQPAAGGGLPTAELPDLERFGPIRREPMSKVRRLTAENLTRAWLTAPQVTNHESVDITDLEAFRQAYKGRVAEAGGKLTMTAILAKVVASTLRHHPTLNAAVDMANNEVVFRESIHVGIAVDTDRGLLVPVVKDADSKDLTRLSIEIDDLATRARGKKLKPDEMQGGTFSISNLGGIGGTGFSPIVNWPEVAILGVSRGRMEARWIDGSFQPRLMLPLSLSYDHRVVDGADAARFLARLKDSLEQPMLLALGG
jgi:pyruvate dehydrogenase E2 component (dihydrolipoamide acetyltransferase)